jgi:hypothetical protein
VPLTLTIEEVKGDYLGFLSLDDTSYKVLEGELEDETLSLSLEAQIDGRSEPALLKISYDEGGFLRGDFSLGSGNFQVLLAHENHPEYRAAVDEAYSHYEKAQTKSREAAAQAGAAFAKYEELRTLYQTGDEARFQANETRINDQYGSKLGELEDKYYALQDQWAELSAVDTPQAEAERNRINREIDQVNVEIEQLSREQDYALEDMGQLQDVQSAADARALTESGVEAAQQAAQVAEDEASLAESDYLAAQYLLN